MSDQIRRPYDFEFESEIRDRRGHLREAGVMIGYRTRWVRPPEQADDRERIVIREELAFGKAAYNQRCALGLSVADLAARADMSVDDVECVEVGTPSPPPPCYGAWPPLSTRTCD